MEGSCDVSWQTDLLVSIQAVICLKGDGASRRPSLTDVGGICT